MSKFNPTKENLNVLVKSLRISDIEHLLFEKLKDCSLDSCVEYNIKVTHDGVDTSCRTVGSEFAKEHMMDNLNIRGEKLY